MVRLASLVVVPSLVAAVALLATPTPARACGGTFCDSGPMAMPVDQTGENIIFVIDETHVEAHIQIQYDPTTDADQFAWIVPVPALPEFAVSSQQLFTNLQNGTVPNFGFVNFFQGCGGDSDGGWDGCDGTGGGGGGDTGDAGGDDGGTTGGGTEVLGEATVGAFDIVVLQATSADDLMMWLAANNYQQDPAAVPILDEYIAEGHLFAAFRLTNGAEIGEVHPIQIRYEGSEPCVPIRLTRIAAQENMAIRAFFLGSQRAVSSNYRHVEWNPIKLDWTGLGGNYEEVVTMAVDSSMADGRAFVTEYAGPSSLVSPLGLFSEAWSSAPFVMSEAVDVIDLLQAQGLVGCDGSSCSYDHPLIEGMLASFLPVPPGLTADEFYNCVSCYTDQFDPMAWDGPAFAQALDERIVQPGAHAVQLLDDHAYLTRLFTTISPGEMTVDPVFHIQEGLPDVDLTAAIGTLDNSCGGNQTMEVPTTSWQVELVDFNTWPDVEPAEMPWAWTVTEYAAGAAPVVLVDNTALIDMLVGQWNGNAGDVDLRPQASCHDFDTGNPPGNTGGQDTDGTDSNGGGQDEGGSGCGCRSGGDPIGAWMLAGLVLGLCGRRRRS